MCTKVHLPCCRCGCPSIANYSVTDLLVLEYSAVHHYCPSQCEQWLEFVDASSTATVLYQSITHEETLVFSDFRMRVANHSLLGSRIYQLPLSFETNGYIAHGHRLVQFVLQTPVVLQSFMHYFYSAGLFAFSYVAILSLSKSNFFSLRLKPGARPSIQFSSEEQAEDTPTPRKRKSMNEESSLSDKQRRSIIRKTLSDNTDR